MVRLTCSCLACSPSPAGDICDAQCNFLCIQERACIQLNALDKPLLCGVPEGTICQVGLGCCAIALKQPELPTILKGKGHCLCCAQSAAFPFDAENPMMCAVCFLSLFPNVGVAMTWSDAMAAAK